MSDKNKTPLTEVGELFVGYKNSSNPYNYSQNTNPTGEKIENEQEKEKDVRLVRKTDDISDSSFKNGFIVKTFDYQNRFYGWQRKIFDSLQAGNDVYVVAPPGGGKTTPSMGFWVLTQLLGLKDGNISKLFQSSKSDPVNYNVTREEHIQKIVEIFSNIINPQKRRNFKKIIFATPIRVLATEQAVAFQEIFTDLLVYMRAKTLVLAFAKRKYEKRLNGGVINRQSIENFLFNHPSMMIRDMSKLLRGIDDQAFDAILSLNPSLYADWANRLIMNNLICVKTGGGDAGFKADPLDALAIIATRGSLRNFITNIVNSVKFIVFDEAHLYQPSEFGGERSQASEVGAADDAYTIIDAVGSNKQIQLAFLSGTINPLSAKNFAEILNKFYGRKVVVNSTEPGDPEARNKSSLRLIADDSLYNEKRLVEIVVDSVVKKKRGEAIILFSKVKIDRIVDAAIKKLSASSFGEIDSIEPVRGGIFNHKQPTYNPDTGRFEYKKEKEKSDLFKRIMNIPGADQIENPELRRAVAYGIGFIYTRDDVDVQGKQPISETDKKLIADLFSNGKINILLATPAIGIGVNVKIQTMFLPTIEKIESTGRDFKRDQMEIAKRDLKQLVGRAGRGVVLISGIYTPSKNIPYVQDVINMSMADYNEVPAISIGNIKSKEAIKSFITRVSLMASEFKKNIKTKADESESKQSSTQVNSFLREKVRKILQDIGDIINDDNMY